MKCKLYAVLIGEKWQWHATVDIRADEVFWFERRGVRKMLCLKPALPLGQALALRDALVERMLLTELGMEGFEEKVQTYVNQQADKHGLDKRWVESLRVTEVDKTSMGRSARFNGPSDSTCEKAAELLRGRSLLVEELQPMFKSYGLGAEADEWQGLVQWMTLQGQVKWTNGFMRQSRRKLFSRAWQHEWRCRRCGSGPDRTRRTPCASCGEQCRYCEECLTMGRNRECSVIILGGERGAESTAALMQGVMGVEALAARGTEIQLAEVDARAVSKVSGMVAESEQEIVHRLERWGLSPAQTDASLAGVKFLTRPATDPSTTSDRFLIWAVTGAGKTEMIFPLVETELLRGGNVVIATPRRDVVLELKPRLQRAFPNYKVVALYGGSEQRWEEGGITLATTHQLLRYENKFDLMIVDELDAFPFHNNPMLQYAAAKAGKPIGKCVFLTATPPPPLKKAALTGRIPYVQVSARYHRRPLPVPMILRLKSLRRIVKDGRSRPPNNPSTLYRAIERLLARNSTTSSPLYRTVDRLSARRSTITPPLYRALEKSINRGAQVFVFVPNIGIVEPLVAALRERFGRAVPMAGTSSKDSERAAKIEAFRRTELRLLVTTTILERGVTVPKSDVFVLDADSKLFDEASLVQMAGRAGRSADDPAGYVYFGAVDVTRSQADAIRHIKRMNRHARKKGYVDDV